jgi:hypothetical protein
MAYQVFERGVMHVDLTNGIAQALSAGDVWRSVLTGQPVSDAMAQRALSSVYWQEYNPANIETGLNWPGDVPGTAMVAAFASDLPRDEITARSYGGRP